MKLPDRRAAHRAQPRWALLVAATCVAPAAVALEILPSVTVGAVYTDNLFLTPTGEVEDVVGRIDPGIVISHNSQRIDLQVDYTYSFLRYAETTVGDASFSSGSATLDLALIKDVLTLETVGERSQQLIDPENGVFFTNVPIIDNRTDETRLETSPHLQTRLGGVGVDVRYVLGTVSYDASKVDDVRYQEAHTAITGEERSNGLSWGLYHDYEIYEFNQPPDNKSQVAYLTLTYGLSKSGTNFVFGSVGMESSYEDFTNASLEDPYWELGIRRQTSRTLIEGAFGERSFGSTIRARIRRELNKGSIELAYREEPSVQESIYDRSSPDDSPQPPDLPGNIDRPGVGDRFVYKLLTAAFVRTVGRSELSLLLFDDARDQFVTRPSDSSGPSDPAPNSGSESETGIVAGLSRQLGRRTAVGASGQYSKRQFRGGNDDQVSELRGFVSYALGQKLSLEGWLARYEQRGSGNPNDEYQELQTGLSATYNFR